MTKFTKLWQLLMILLISSSVLVAQAQKNVSTEKAPVKNIEQKKETSTSLEEQIKMLDDKGLKGEELAKTIVTSLNEYQLKMLEENGYSKDLMMTNESAALKALEYLKENENPSDNFLPEKQGDGTDAVNAYTFGQAAGTYTAITGGTLMKDGTTTQDSWVSTAQTIPSFTFDGVAYTTAFVTSNGILTLGGTAPSAFTTTGISTTTGSGIALCPFSADLDRATTTASTEIRWETVGNEVVFQWQQIKRYGATESFDMQVRMNTSTGVIKFVYQLNSGPGTSTSYQPQVGIRTSTTDYLNRLVSTGTEDWATSLPGTLNTNTCRFTSTAPAKGFTTGLTYTFTPPLPCSGTPAPGNTLSTANPVFAGINFTLSLQNATPGSGVTYQWQTSPNGSAPWTNVGTSSPTYTTSQTAVTYYRCEVTCSGNTGTSTPIQVTMYAAPVPYEEGFITTTVPTGWNTTGWSIGAVRGVTGNPGNNIYKNLWSSATTGTFTTVDIGLVASGMLLTFDYKAANYVTPYDPPAAGSGNYIVSISTNYGVSYTDLETVVNDGIAGWKTKSYSLTSYIGYNIKIKIVGNWVSGDWDLAFDNFKVQVPPTCPAPTSLTVTTITSTSADIGWTSGLTAWEYQYGLAGFTPAATGTATTLNPTPISGLLSNTSYDFYVRANCGSGDYSTWAGPKNFKTLCGVSTAFIENFDAVVTPALPDCWTKIGGGSAYTQTTTPFSAPNCLYIYGYSGAIPVVTMPPVSNAGANTHQLRFQARANYTVGAVVEVGYMTNPTDPLTFTLLQSITLNALTYAEYTVYPGTAPGSNQVLAFRQPATPAYSALIDNVVWELKPTCPPPVSLTVTNITTSSASLGWTETGSATAWEYQYGLAGFTPAATGAPTTVNPTPISGLSSSTSYDFYVRANCGSGDFSAWSGPKNFKTPCNAYVIPWSENFDAMTIIGNNILPDCWLATSPSGTPWTSGNAASITYNDPCSSPNYVYVSYSPSLVDKFLITPGFNLTAATSYDFKFNWVGDGLAGWTGDVLVNTDQTGTGATVMGSPFVVAATTTSATCTQATRSFIPPTSGIYYFMVRVNNTGVPWYLGFDDFGVELSPACPPPFDLTATGITANSANIGWTSLATAWEYQVGLAGFIPAATGTPTTVNPTPVGGLLASTCYDFYVRANCGGGVYSTWAGPYTFCTQCDVFSLPFSESFPTASFPNCWTEQFTGLITSSHWSMVNSANAGGTAYEARAYYSPSQGSTQDDNDRFVTPGLNTTGLTSIKVSFRQFLDDYLATPTGGVWIKVQSSANGTTWTDEWVYNGGFGIDIPAEVKELTITNNLGATTYIAWTLSGYTYNINYWYVDDVVISVPLAHDVKTVSVDVPGLIVPGSTLPLATVANNGTNVETFNVTMTITPGTYTSTKTVTALNPGTPIQVTFDAWNAVVGNYTVNVCTQLAGDLDPANDCVAKPVSVQVLRKVYCYVTYDPTAGLPEGPAWFYVQDPGTITSLAATTSPQFISAGAWANGVWYGAEYYDDVALSGGGWWSINPTNGAMNLIADFDQGFTGIAYNNTTNVMYGTDWDAVALTNKLFTIDPLTGVSTLLGTYGTSLVINLACNGTDLYGIGLSDDQMYKIFPTTPPTAVAIGPTGYAFNYAQDMEYDYDNNIMYVAGYTTLGSLYTANLATGACTPVGDFQGGAEITGFAIPYVTGYRIYGNVYYGDLNNLKPQVTTTSVTLTPGLPPPDPTTVPAGAGGAFEFSLLDNDTYGLTGTSGKAWGGLNAPDPSFTQQYILGTRVLTNLQKRAADINLSGTIQSLDVTMMKRRILGQTYASWIKPNEMVWDGPFVPGWHGVSPTWIQTGLSVIVAGSDVNQNVRCLFTGDVNESFTPLPNP